MRYSDRSIDDIKDAIARDVDSIFADTSAKLAVIKQMMSALPDQTTMSTAEAMLYNALNLMIQECEDVLIWLAVREEREDVANDIIKFSYGKDFKIALTKTIISPPEDSLEDSDKVSAEQEI
jgi:hypothetical protein